MWPKPRQFQQLRSLDILERSIWGPPRPPFEAMSAWSSSPATLASARALRSWAVSCLGLGRMSPERKWLRHKSSKKLMQDWKSRPFRWLVNCRAAPCARSSFFASWPSVASILVSMLARNLVVSSSSVFRLAGGRSAFRPFRCRENSVMESRLKPTLFRMVALFQLASCCSISRSSMFWRQFASSNKKAARPSLRAVACIISRSLGSGMCLYSCA